MQHSLRKLIQIYKQKCNFPRILAWSGGCVAQFKSRNVFLALAQANELFGIQIQCSYGGSGRFKGRHDAAGGGLKRFWRAQELKSSALPR